MPTVPDGVEQRALVLAPVGRDAELTSAVLSQVKLPVSVCGCIGRLTREIEKGAALAVIAEEALTTSSIESLESVLRLQPPWSDLPLVVLTGGGRSTTLNLQRFHFLEKLGNITLLERPVRTTTLQAAVRAAVRSRRRQYEIRDYLVERRNAEEALAKQADDLARSNADLQQFAYVTSHDLQEPLRSIASFSQMLGQRYRGKLDADADEFIAYITSGVHRMQALIQDLLEYSRVANQQGIERAPVPLEEVLEWATQNLKRSIEESGSEISWGPLPSIVGDRVELVQLFENLLSNAVKYRKPDGRLQVRVTAEQHESNWLILVEDNGIGFDPQYREQIFKIFKRLHGGEIPGTGIGLTICRKVVERHGGRIWAESKAGEGTRFWFTLPANG